MMSRSHATGAMLIYMRGLLPPEALVPSTTVLICVDASEPMLPGGRERGVMRDLTPVAWTLETGPTHPSCLSRRAAPFQERTGPSGVDVGKLVLTFTALREPDKYFFFFCFA